MSYLSGRVEGGSIKSEDCHFEHLYMISFSNQLYYFKKFYFVYIKHNKFGQPLRSFSKESVQRILINKKNNWVIAFKMFLVKSSIR